MRRKGARRALFAVIAVSTLIGTAAPTRADLGDCGQPVSSGAGPVATDCLFILRVAVNLDDCEPVCACDTTGGGGLTAPDALACLQFVVGALGSLDCPCDATTTTTLGGGTTTTTLGGSTTTSTTLPPTTTTTTEGPTTTTTTTSTTTSSTTTTTVVGCEDGGVSYAGSCWFTASAAEVSCDAVCANVSRSCDEAATRDVAGSGGTLAACSDLVTLLVGAPDQNLEGIEDICGSPDLGIGCVWLETNEFPPPEIYAIRTLSPVTTCAADGAGGICVHGGRRICACVE